ncbi:MAG TPA: cell division protein FtsZ, partial [Gammaproteobacteria bacterium]|nr:cell division protein FtsZ [Gammaproteobacteria bacterium]
NATVLVGTVIDPEMTDEMRVTVVVTGIDGKNLIDDDITPSAAALGVSPEPRVDYHKLDRPAVLRKKNTPVSSKPAEYVDQDVEYLDIPAFLRRKEKADTRN